MTTNKKSSISWQDLPNYAAFYILINAATMVFELLVIMDRSHFAKLEHMYLQANVNTMIFDTTTCKISDGQAEISLEISEKYFHGLGAIHGSVYFKLLDDAAFFAINSIVEDAFVLTTSFNLNLLRPANSGRITAIGNIKFRSRDLFVAESILYNEKGKEIAFGSGNFVKSKIKLSKEIGYK